MRYIEIKNTKCIQKYIQYLAATAVAILALCLLISGSYSSVHAASQFPSKPRNLMVTAAKGKVVATWEKTSDANYYAIYQTCSRKSLSKAKIAKLKFVKIKVVKNNKATIKDLKKGQDYHFYVTAGNKYDGKIHYGEKSDIHSVTLPSTGKSTVKNLLRTGLAPVGTTLYVWGGGWNKADTGTGKTAKMVGLYPSWQNFYKKHKKNYNFRKHRYKITKGLDCSGFVGWTVYNILENTDGHPGYVTWAEKQGKWFAKKGFGQYSAPSKVKSHNAGDIMTCRTHVWMAIGDCSDGSVVILHASPPAVGLAGTPAKNGKKNSEAVKLARKYMKKYYTGLYNAYGKKIVIRGNDYRTSYGRMRWNKKTLSDPEGYRKMKANDVLADLFKEK